MRLAANIASVSMVAVCLTMWRQAIAEPVLFCEPVNVAEINSPYTDRDPTLSSDGLEIFFASNRPGGEGHYDIWYATRPSWTTPFSTPINLAQLNAPGWESDTFLSADGLSLYFTRGWTGHTSGFDLFVATRSDRQSPFGDPTPLTDVNTAANERGPHASGDGLTLYFNTGAAPHNEEIFRVTREAATESFGAPVRLAELGAPGYDRDPWVSADGLSVFFSSDRPAFEQGFRVFFASRATADVPFGPVRQVEGLYGAEWYGAAPFFDERRSLLYYHAYEVGSDSDIYVARVVPEPFSMAFMGSAFVGMVGWRVRRRRRGAGR